MAKKPGLGIGLGLIALQKTIYKLSTVSGIVETAAWYDINKNRSKQ